MADISVTLVGAKEIIRKFANTAIIRDELKQAGERSNYILRRSVGISYTRNKPPRPSRSKYVRTYKLMRGWNDRVKPYATGVTAFMGNAVEYGPDVLDADHQEPIHAGRWPTTRSILADKRDAIVNAFTAARDAIVRRLG